MIDAIYEIPFEAHATLEPMNCTAHVHDGICEVWAPTQNPQAVQLQVAAVTGIPQANVTVNVAYVAEVLVDDDGVVHVRKVVAAVDCGEAINPDNVAAQIEGGIAFGLTAALKAEATLKDGRVQQSNFHDCPILRIDEMPLVEVHILKSSQRPSGMGEMGVPPIAPAVANAVFAATGKRIRHIPIKPEDLKA